MSDETKRPHREAEDWWRTSIIRMEPNVIEIRGSKIQNLIGKTSFVEMIWLMLRGGVPTKGQARLLEAALVASVDHGPQAPSIGAARMAATCGVGLNNALATGVNLLGDVHGGAGEQAARVYHSVAEKTASGASLSDAVSSVLADLRASGQKYVPGFGHRFHDRDPRAPRLMAEVSKSAADGIVEGKFAEIGITIERKLSHGRSRPIPMNIDGATAVIFCELGFDPALARGLFCLSRSVGILAHAWEQSQQGGRNKGPLPKEYLWTFDASL